MTEFADYNPVARCSEYFTVLEERADIFRAAQGDTETRKQES